MVNIQKAVPYEEIKAQLKKDDRIAIFTCNSCVRFCGTGGVDKMEALASRLRRDGYVVSDEIVLVAACLHDHVRNARLSGGVTAAVVLACEAGWASVKQRLRGENVIKGTNSMGLIVIDREKGVEKLMMPYKDYKDQLGNEFKLLTGEPQAERVMDMEVEE